MRPSTLLDEHSFFVPKNQWLEDWSYFHLYHRLFLRGYGLFQGGFLKMALESQSHALKLLHPVVSKDVC